jgi:hypothetical protein
MAEDTSPHLTGHNTILDLPPDIILYGIVRYLEWYSAVDLLSACKQLRNARKELSADKCANMDVPSIRIERTADKTAWTFTRPPRYAPCVILVLPSMLRLEENSVVARALRGVAHVHEIHIGALYILALDHVIKAMAELRISAPHRVVLSYKHVGREEVDFLPLNTSLKLRKRDFEITCPAVQDVVVHTRSLAAEVMFGLRRLFPAAALTLHGRTGSSLYSAAQVVEDMRTLGSWYANEFDITGILAGGTPDIVSQFASMAADRVSRLYITPENVAEEAAALAELAPNLPVRADCLFIDVGFQLASAVIKVLARTRPFSLWIGNPNVPENSAAHINWQLLKEQIGCQTMDVRRRGCVATIEWGRPVAADELTRYAELIHEAIRAKVPPDWNFIDHPESDDDDNDNNDDDDYDFDDIDAVDAHYY